MFCFFSFHRSDNINRKIYQSIHPSIQKPATLLSAFNCCELSANLSHWLDLRVPFFFFFFDVFEGADKRVWQLWKDFKHDKDFHYVTIKSKTLICHFYPRPSVRQSIRPYIHIHPSIKWPKWVRKDQKGYEMTWCELTIIKSFRTQLTKMGTKWPWYEMVVTGYEMTKK